MEEIIDRLIELENKAKKITNEAKQKEETLAAQIKTRQEQTEASINADYQKKIDEMKEREKCDEDQSLDEINQKKESQLQNLQNDFINHHLEWEDYLFNSVIGR